MHIMSSPGYCYVRNLSAAFLLVAVSLGTQAQNLSSLVKGKNINATFSITAYDPAAEEWGIAVATNNIYVGNSTVYVQAGLGAFSVIAETEPSYAINGFEALKAGKDIRESIEITRRTDSQRYSRQVAGIDAQGHCYSFTGSTWKYQQGFSGSLTGLNCIVMGNQLGDSVLVRMRAAFENTAGALAIRLLAAITAGERAGGQVSGKQSAALAVKGIRNEWFNNIDLRVDDAKDPFKDLTKLLNYHYGRIRLNQAVFAYNMGNKNLGGARLVEAEKMLAGWNSIQNKIAAAYITAGNNAKAVSVIKNAIRDNPKFAVNLPAFYLLKDEPGMTGLINEKKFTEKNWISAVNFLSTLNRNTAAIALSQKAIALFPSSSYLYYLMGQSLANTGEKKEAATALQKAVALDPDNQEAADLLKQPGL